METKIDEILDQLGDGAITQEEATTKIMALITEFAAGYQFPAKLVKVDRARDGGIAASSPAGGSRSLDQLDRKLTLGKKGKIMAEAKGFLATEIVTKTQTSNARRKKAIEHPKIDHAVSSPAEHLATAGRQGVRLPPHG